MSATGFQVTAAVAYLDTLGLYCFRRLPDGLLESLRKEYGPRLTVKPIRTVVGPLCTITRWLITIQQPTTATLETLNAIKPRPFTVHRVDIPIDFLCRTHAESELATEFLRRCVVQKWRRRRHRTNLTTTTSYWKHERKAPRNIALYGDRPSKTGLGPCSHLELRFTGAAACNRAGLSDLASLIVGLDVTALLERQAFIGVIDPKCLDRQLEEVARNTVRSRRRFTVKEVKVRAGQLLGRALQEEHVTFHQNTIAEPRSQELGDRFPWLRRSLRRVPWAGFTPAPRWTPLGAGGDYTIHTSHIDDNQLKTRE